MTARYVDVIDCMNIYVPDTVTYPVIAFEARNVNVHQLPLKFASGQLRFLGLSCPPHCSACFRFAVAVADGEAQGGGSGQFQQLI